MIAAEVRLGPPRLWLFGTVSWALVLCGLSGALGAAILTSESADNWQVIFPLLFTCFLSVRIILESRVGAGTSSDALVVRNFRSRTTTFSRADISDFRADGARHAIYIIPKQGELTSIDATVQRRVFQKDRHPAQLDELRTWLAAGD